MSLLLLFRYNPPAAFWWLGTKGAEQHISQCDCEMDMSEEQLCREARTAGGALKRDVIAVKRVWAFRYSWLPGKQHNVWDRGMGRDELRALYAATVGTPSATLRFAQPVEDGGPEIIAVQFIANSWKDRLVQRNSPYGYICELSFGLMEV